MLVKLPLQRRDFLLKINI